MDYNVVELRKNLSQKILGLGVDKNFLENPAYEAVVGEIDSLISQMNLADAEEIKVREGEGKISFECNQFGKKYSIYIYCSNPREIKCFRTIENEPFLGTNGQYITQKEYIEEKAILNESGFVELATHGARVNDAECDRFHVNCNGWAEQKSYNKDGVMTDREHVNLKDITYQYGINNIDNVDVLSFPRGAFIPGNDRYIESKSILRRSQLDVARYVRIENGEIQYSSDVPLNQEHGLRDLVLQNGDYQEHVVISAISKEEIEMMIQKEKNPKVAEGLRKYSTGRESYSYDSSLDPRFVCQIQSEYQDRSR